MRRGISPVKVLALIGVVIIALVPGIVKSHSWYQSGSIKQMVWNDIFRYVSCSCRHRSIPCRQVCRQGQIR